MNKIRAVLNYLEERFGIPGEVFDDYEIIDDGDIWLVSKDAAGFEIRTFRRKGLRLARFFKDGKIKVTTAALQIIGKYATKNIVYLNESELLMYVRGQDIEKSLPNTEPGQVIVKYKSDCIGSGLYQNGRIKNQLPKGRRIAIQLEPRLSRFIKAVIFDLDGVILDSEPLHVKAANAALNEFGIQLTVEKNAPFMGLDERVYWQKLIEYFGIDAAPEYLANKKKQAYLKILQEEELIAYPDVIKFINMCKDEGLKLAIASSSSHEEIEIILKKLSLIEKFDVIVSSEDVRSGKPSPDIFLLASEKLGTPPEKCLVIEDSVNGIDAAKSAGMKVVAYRAPIGREKADLSVSDFNKLSRGELVQIFADFKGEQT